MRKRKKKKRICIKLGVDTLRQGVDLEAPLRHLGVPEELEREPDEVAPDLLELLAYVLGGQELVEDVARLDAPRGQVAVVVLECFDCSVAEEEVMVGCGQQG